MHLNPDRRHLLKRGLAVAVVTLTGCGGGSDASSPVGTTPSPPPVAETWNPSVPPLLVGTNSSFNLSATLPAGVARGGRFGLDASGASLPPGMTLSAAGVLSVGSAAIGTVTGVVFTYETT